MLKPFYEIHSHQQLLIEFTLQDLDKLYVLFSSAHKTTRRNRTCTVLKAMLNPNKLKPSGSKICMKSFYLLWVFKKINIFNIQDGARNSENSPIFRGHKGVVISTQRVQKFAQNCSFLTVQEITNQTLCQLTLYFEFQSTSESKKNTKVVGCKCYSEVKNKVNC